MKELNIAVRLSNIIKASVYLCSVTVQLCYSRAIERMASQCLQS